jgi:hypothetical protein
MRYFLEEGVPQDYKAVVYWHTKAAQGGHACAQNNLGAMYEGGLGVLQDLAKAAFWYTKAAEQGNAKAQIRLGNLYYYECKGVSRDNKKAFEWYSKAAVHGDVEAQYNLGLMYETGEGIPHDNVMAHMFFDIAANAGGKGTWNRSIVAEDMTSSELEKAQLLAREWMLKHQSYTE